MKVLVTGSAGMIGSNLTKNLIMNNIEVIGIDKKEIKFENNYFHYSIDLGDIESIRKIFKDNLIDRVIHLAALAHTKNGEKYSKKMYKYMNVECANNVFKVANEFNVPVLYISTVDVFGFQNNVVNIETPCHPVTIYGKTKFEAENLLINSGCSYTIFRLSPVYSANIKRDIQKRIYLKYPKWAYQIGKNTYYEVLDINKAIERMKEWCILSPMNNIMIIKDETLLNTKDYIQKEKNNGNANHVIYVPRWLALIGYYILRVTGKNKYTFLINKAINPLRSE